MDEYKKPSHGIFVPLVGGIVGSLLLSYAVSKTVNASTLDSYTTPIVIQQDDLETRVKNEKKDLTDNFPSTGGRLYEGEYAAYFDRDDVPGYHLQAGPDYFAIMGTGDDNQYGYVIFDGGDGFFIPYNDFGKVRTGDLIDEAISNKGNFDKTKKSKYGNFIPINISAISDHNGKINSMLDRFKEAIALKSAKN